MIRFAWRLLEKEWEQEDTVRMFVVAQFFRCRWLRRKGAAVFREDPISGLNRHLEVLNIKIDLTLGERMDFTVNYDERIFEIKTKGRAELDVFMEFADAVVSDPNWQPGSLLLVDHSELDANQLTTDELKRIAKYTLKEKERWRKAKIAVVVSDDLNFGLARMWQAFADSPELEISGNIFRDRADAIHWLLSDS